MKQDKHEPVAWMQESTGCIRSDWKFDKTGYVPLYTAAPQPQKWVGLTDEDKLAIRKLPWEWPRDLIAHTEDKLREKNTAPQPQREWKGLTPSELEQWSPHLQGFAKALEIILRERNGGAV